VALLLEKIISARDWPTVREFWDGYSENSDELTIEETVVEAFAGQLPEKGEEPKLFPLPGIGGPGRITLDIMRAKASAGRRGFCAVFDSGNISWSNVDAYHSSFLYIRALLAFFGVFSFRCDSSDYFVDIFPHFGMGSTYGIGSGPTVPEMISFASGAAGG
jgi:hypothetical protein